jgi:hypothetical protein
MLGKFPRKKPAQTIRARESTQPTSDQRNAEYHEKSLLSPPVEVQLCDDAGEWGCG